MVRIRVWVRVPTDPCPVSLAIVHTWPYLSVRIGAITMVPCLPTRRCLFSAFQWTIGMLGATKHPTCVGVHRELQVIVSHDFTEDVIGQEISCIALNKDSRTTTTMCVQNQYHKQCQMIICNNPSLNIISFHFSLVFSFESRK
ncbi:hypothetical protein ACB094_06G231700 [Castanea mollissima]